MKYVVRPTSPRRSEKPRQLTESYLLDNMRDHLAHGDATFDFCVQFQTDPEKMPIEDAMVEWDEKDSPYRKVATIRIPSQAFESFDQMALAEKIAFNPWSCAAGAPAARRHEPGPQAHLHRTCQAPPRRTNPVVPEVSLPGC